jgi:hypothetical protein
MRVLVLNSGRASIACWLLEVLEKRGMRQQTTARAAAASKTGPPPPPEPSALVIWMRPGSPIRRRNTDQAPPQARPGPGSMPIDPHVPRP